MSSATLPEELSYLLTSFQPSADESVRSKAFLILSSYCQGVRSKSPNPESATEILRRTFSQVTVPRIQETDNNVVLSGVTFFEALFEVDPDAASAIFQEDGITQTLADIADIGPNPELALSMSHLLSQAIAQKTCRSMIPPELLDWLKAESRLEQSRPRRAAASLALLKYSKGDTSDLGTTQSDNEPADLVQEDALVDFTIDTMLSDSSPTSSSIADAVEALAYLSTKAQIKEKLSKRSDFLTKLFSLVPQKKSPLPHSTLHYGVLIIIANICAYKPQLSEEQSQINKLKQMAKASSVTPSDTSSPLDDSPAVKLRVRRLVDSGVLNIFPLAASESSSQGVKIATSKTLLSIVEDTSNRGKVLQSGGAKILISIINQFLASNSKDSALDAIQALAKLTITSSPVQVYGPSEGRMFDAIRPFSFMLQHSSANLLQKFEATMALTNLASYSPTVATRVAQADGLLSHIEVLLLEDHVLIRRASMELICNLIAGSDDVFERYSSAAGGGTSSKVHILVVMSDVEDTNTRLAASGALATIASSPQVCRVLLNLQKERHSAFGIISQLIYSDPTAGPEDPGLVHRGLVIVRSLTSSQDSEFLGSLRSEAKESGLLDSLRKVVGQNLESGLRELAVESLRVLVASDS